MAIVTLSLLVGQPLWAGEWWQEDGGRSWGSGGKDGGTAWAESRDDAWWLDPVDPAPSRDTDDQWRDRRSGGQPWGLRNPPPQQKQEQRRKTYNPWSDWSDRPWGDTGSRSDQERQTRERESTRRRDEVTPWGGGMPAYPGYGPAPAYPSGPVPGYGTGPWGGVPPLPGMPAPY
ncbi:MAG: hypothetical protein U5S82_11130 [Gammaproteobacteria bacterium]|nr:hypothetical protein [Gammaproteobacteria bacterium]